MAVQATATAGQRRGRRPTEEVRADILETVGALLLSEGIADLTFERVAREAGVSKTTLYKWWPSMGALALDGYFHAVEETLAFHDTGDIRTDLLSQLLAFTHVMTRTPAGRALIELVGQSQTDHELAVAFRKHYSTQRRRLAGERLQQAQQQGQVRPDVDVQVVVDQLWGPIYHRLLVPDEPVTDDFTRRLVANLFDAIATPNG